VTAAGKNARTEPSRRGSAANRPSGGLAPAGPLRPRRRLFIGLMILLLIWVVILLVMYFTTVYLHRHGAPQIGMGQISR